VTTVSARATSGGINLLETDALIVGDTSATVHVVQANGTTADTTDATQSDVRDVGRQRRDRDPHDAGSLTLNDGTALADNTAISANGSGNVLLQAIGAGTSITGNADVLSATGNLTLLAAQDIIFTAGADIQTAGAGSAGTIDLVAGTGTINLSTTSNTTSVSGDIRLWAATDIQVGG